MDDEPLGRERIRSLLEDQADVEVVGECGDGLSAVEAIARLRPDVVFLDVQMPEVDGFGVIERAGLEGAPAFIFVTAYDKYALQAFEVHALDYLLKPYDRARFLKALDRARAQIRKNGDKADLGERLLALLRDVKAETHLERLVVKTSGRIFFLKPEEIDFVEACGNYVRLHAGSESHLLRDTMSGMERKLDPRRFVRIHRSTVVNIDRVKELQPLFHGEYAVILRSGRRLTLSRGYRYRLRELLGGAL